MNSEANVHSFSSRLRHILVGMLFSVITTSDKTIVLELRNVKY
jgi:hypothetical protein